MVKLAPPHLDSAALARVAGGVHAVGVQVDI